MWVIDDEKKLLFIVLDFQVKKKIWICMYLCVDFGGGGFGKF